MKTITQAFGTKASGDANQPLEIYDLYLDSEVLHLVNYDKNISYFDPDGTAATYIAIPISRGVLERSVENPINTMTAGIANVDRAMSAYLAANDFRGRKIVIRKVFADQLTSSGDCIFVFDGTMDSPAASQETIQISATDKIGTLNKEAPKRWYQLLCNNKFMDDQCGYGRTSGDMYATVNGTCSGDCTISLIKSSNIIQARNYWIDGEVRLTSGNNFGKKRRIVYSSGDQNLFKLDTSLDYAPISGDTYTIRRGCDKTWFRCSGDYSNDQNFAGYPTIPANMVIR